MVVRRIKIIGRREFLCLNDKQAVEALAASPLSLKGGQGGIARTRGLIYFVRKTV